MHSLGLTTCQRVANQIPGRWRQVGTQGVPKSYGQRGCLNFRKGYGMKVNFTWPVMALFTRASTESVCGRPHARTRT